MRYLHSSVSTLRHSTIFLIFLEVSFLFLFWGVWERRSWFYWTERLRSVGVSASNDLSALADGVLRAAEEPGVAFFAWGREAAASSSPTLNGASFGSTLLSIECGHDYMGVSRGSSDGARTTTGDGDRRRRQANDGERRTPPRSASFCFLYTGCIGKALSPWVPFFFYNWYEYVSIWLLLSGGLDTQRTATWELVPGWRGKALLQRTAFFRPTCCFAVEG